MSGVSLSSLPQYSFSHSTPHGWNGQRLKVQGGREVTVENGSEVPQPGGVKPVRRIQGGYEAAGKGRSIDGACKGEVSRKDECGGGCEGERVVLSCPYTAQHYSLSPTTMRGFNPCRGGAATLLLSQQR